MATALQAEIMAKRLRGALAARGTDISKATALDLVAVELGHATWSEAATEVDVDSVAGLTDKNYGYGRPGLDPAHWGDEVVVHDPFGNRIRFCQKRDA